ncbi:MFS transporter [Haladaptatus salinisoli]|uniref:MFS transporter n=1 Tax=Haladaptatus salinisoli TaxID=2884876 RepID=UPI001D0A899E|nr:MFS transporter [Haladaptatus salinisoli]
MHERTRSLAVASVVLLLSVLVWFNYSALLPQIVDAWSLSGVQAGALFAAFQAGYVVAVIPAGMVADGYSTRRVVAVGATGTGLASVAFAALADGFLVGVFFRFVAGAFMAGVYVPGMRFLSEWYPESARGRALGVYTGAFSLSTGLSFLLSSSVAAALDWRVAIGATSVGAVVAGPLMLAFARDHPDAAVSDRRFDRRLLSNRAYLYAVGVYAGHTWEVFGVRNWMPAFLVATTAVAGASEPTVLAGLLTGAMMSLGGVGNLLGGWASDSVGRIRTVLAVLGASACISAILGLLDWLSLPALTALLLLYGALLTADSSPTSTAVTEVVADEHVGVALSVQTLAGFSATVVSPVVFGAVLDTSGYAWAFLTLALGAAFGLVSLGLLSRRLRRSPRVLEERAATGE